MKKRVISLLLALVLALGLLPATAWAAEAKKISTAEAFAQMDANGNYILTEDITVSTPYANDFSGTFDGNGHTITLNIEQSKANLGLFKTLAGKAIIKNVIVTGKVSAGSNNKIGGIAGFANVYSGEISIINCKNDATISGNKSVGGILGDCSGNQNKLTIEGCVNIGKITGNNSQVGGIIGNLGSGHSVSYCYNRGDITGFNYAGGIVGQCASKISSSYSTGNVNLTSTKNNKGDIFGGGKASKENCFSADGSDGS